MRRGLGTLLLAAIVAASAGCSKELTAGGQTSEVTTTMSDGEPGSTSQRMPAGPGQLHFALLPAAGGPQGTVHAALQVALVTASGAVDPIAASSAASVGIGSSIGTMIGLDSVATGSYTIARVTFSSVTADVTGGLLGVGGIPVVGSIAVELTEPVTLDFPIALSVQPFSEHQIVVDLNASTWLAAVNPATLKVPAAAFRAALAVRAE